MEVSGALSSSDKVAVISRRIGDMASEMMGMRVRVARNGKPISDEDVQSIIDSLQALAEEVKEWKS